MTPIGLLLELDYRIDDLRGRIHVEHERIAQLELEGRNSSKALEALAALERYLRETIRQRNQVEREVAHHRWMENRRKLN